MHEGGAQPKSSCIRCTSCGHESRIISIHVSWQPLRPSLNRNFIKKIKACDKRFTWTVGRLASPGSSNTCRGHNLRQWPASIWIISPDIPEEIKIKKKKDRERKGISISDKSRKGGSMKFQQGWGWWIVARAVELFVREKWDACKSDGAARQCSRSPYKIYDLYHVKRWQDIRRG